MLFELAMEGSLECDGVGESSISLTFGPYSSIHIVSAAPLFRWIPCTLHDLHHIKTADPAQNPHKAATVPPNTKLQAADRSL